MKDPRGTPTKRVGSEQAAQASPAASPESAKKTRLIAKRKSKGPPRKQGVREDAKSFVKKIWEKEGECAAYLGYGFIDEFRRFAISPLVLSHYSKLGSEGRTVRQESVLEVLRDCAEEMETDQDPDAAYPPSHSGKAAFRVALIVAQARRGIQKALSERYVFTQQEVEEACATFDKEEEKDIPRIDPSKVTLVFPKLGPFKNLGEDDLEAYVRVFALLKYIQYSSNAPWNTRFGSEKWDLRMAVGASHVPEWMIPKESTSTVLAPDAPLKPVGLPIPQKPAIKIRCIWKYDAKTPDAEEYREVVDSEELEDQLPVLEQEITLEPAARREHVLDDVRRQYKLHTLKAQIKSLRLKLVGESKRDLEAVSEDWSKIQSALWDNPWDATKSAFHMIVRPAEEGELIFESKMPFRVEQFLTVKDGDICRIAPDADHETDDEQQLDATEGYVYALREGSRERKVLDPVKMFGDRRDDMLKFYDGHDPTTEAGLLAWQRQAFDTVTRGDERRKTKNSAKFKRGGVKLTPAEATALEAARSEGEHAAFNLAEASAKEDDAENHYYNLNQIHTGTSTQVGPPLEPCATALEMTPFINDKGQTMYKSRDPNLAKCAFFPWQVTGTCAALVGAIGYIPTRKDAPAEVKKAADSLKGLAIGGKLICDQTGLGKTILLLANYFYINFHEDLDAEGKPVYKMMVLVVPAGVLKQWADEVIDKWPSLELLISYEESGLNAQKYKRHILSATALKAYPDQKRWPKQYRYIFDKSNPKTGRTLLLTSNETHVTRTLKSKWVSAGFDAEGKLKRDSDGVPLQKKERYSLLRGEVSRGGVDEGHKMKDRTTRRWKSFKDMQAPINWVMGATPMSNRSIVSRPKSAFETGWANTPSGFHSST